MASAPAAANQLQASDQGDKERQSGHNGKEDGEVRVREEVARRPSAGDELATATRRRSMENSGQSDERNRKLERAQSASSRRRGRLGLVRSLESSVPPTTSGETQSPRPSQLFSLRQLALGSRNQLAKKRPSVQAEAVGSRGAQTGPFARLLELTSSSQDSQSSSGSSAENSCASDERRARGHSWSDGRNREEANEEEDDGDNDNEDDDDDYEDDSEEDYEDEEGDELSEGAAEWAPEAEKAEAGPGKAVGETQVVGRQRRRRRRQRRASGCPCEPLASIIGRDGLPVTDVDLASYKDLCQLAQARHLRTGQRRHMHQHLEPMQAFGSLTAAAARRSSLQEESGAYYQLCTSQEEQTIRARYLWFPPALKQLRQVELFFAGFPRDKVPAVVGPKEAPKEAPALDGQTKEATQHPARAPGAYRDEQISFQLPQQDMALDYCSYPMDEVARRAYGQFVDKRNSQALDVASVVEVAAAPSAQHHSGQRKASQGADNASRLDQLQQQRCRRCLVRLEPGQLAVVAPNFVIGSAPYRAPAIPEGEAERAGAATGVSSPRPPLAHHAALFHPICFTCSTCKEFLVDLVYCLRDNKLYCVRHYGESLRPRCAWCQEVSSSLSGRQLAPNKCRGRSQLAVATSVSSPCDEADDDEPTH